MKMLTSEIVPYKSARGAAMRAQEKTGWMHLDWNEAGYPPSPLVWPALVRAACRASLCLYPDIEATELREALGYYTGLPPELLRVYNGSDAALRDICIAFLGPGKAAAMYRPTYGQFETFASALGSPIHTLNFSLWPPPLVTADLVYIAHPNNPTGTVFQGLPELVASRPDRLFVIDEAYFEYHGYTEMGLVQPLENVIVTRTLSKAFALAGLRIGYLAACPKILERLDTIRNGKDVSVLAQIAGVAALADVEYMKGRVGETRETLNWLVPKLNALPGVSASPTTTNFVPVKVPDKPALMAALEKAHILVRDGENIGLGPDYIRVTIGAREHVERFLQVVEEVCTASKAI